MSWSSLLSCSILYRVMLCVTKPYLCFQRTSLSWAESSKNGFFSSIWCNSFFVPSVNGDTELSRDVLFLMLKQKIKNRVNIKKTVSIMQAFDWSTSSHNNIHHVDHLSIFRGEEKDGNLIFMLSSSSDIKSIWIITLSGLIILQEHEELVRREDVTSDADHIP